METGLNPKMVNQYASQDAIQELEKHQSEIEKPLIESLEIAEANSKSLDPALRDALAWPTTWDDYIQFLQDFAKWSPRQDTDAAWARPDGNGSQEVYDRLCHFHFLIDQTLDDGTTLQETPWFSSWLVQYANTWGSYLNTTESFNDGILQSFLQDSPEYQVEASMIDGRPNAPSGWLTFNQFFARELNPGLRPIQSPPDNAVVTSPADCTFKAMYAINEDSTIPEITIKQSHKFASIHDLLDGSPYADAFANGTFVHYFLGPYSYHRFHAPVSGVLRECRSVLGNVMLNVAIDGGQFNAADSSQGGYEFSQARGILILDTKDSPYGDMGLVAVIPVGMCQVSSVNMTATLDAQLQKGDEFGYFLFGGSDIIVLFQKGASPQVDTSTQYRHYGSKIADCTKQ